MDKFVTRTQTWKTLNYSSMTAQSFVHKKSLAKTSSNKSKPLQQKQLSELTTQPNDFDKRRGDLLPSSNQTNAENFNGNSNDSGLSSASSISPQQIDDNLAGYRKLHTPTKNHLRKLGDYIDCPVEKENDTYMTITHTPRSHKKVVESGQEIHKTLEAKQKLTSQIEGSPERPLPTANSMIMARIQRDLNSPSAAARMKAIKALKSPTKSAYSHFDIPEAEQSFHLPKPTSLQEIMRNIVVYVEVRSGEDNRSAGVRKVIEALGARVNLSLNRDTTHVIFKEGLMSTYKKATQMNIPIVSILWIEACKNQGRICDPKDFPISNLDRYENPELYTKMKRVKCMQPDSECNKRIRAKAGGTPKDSTPTQKTGNLKKTSTFIGGTPTSSTNKKKTDISQFFKKLERPTPSTTSKVDGGINGTAIIPESPATQLLKRIHSECYTPLKELQKKTTSKENGLENEDNSSKTRIGIKKTLDFLQEDNVEGNIDASITCKATVNIKATIREESPLPKNRGRQKRNSLMPACDIETATNSKNTMAISATPSRSTSRRRSSINTPKDMSLAAQASSRKDNIQPIIEESCDVEKKQDEPPKTIKRRRTLYAVKTMDQSGLLKSGTNEDIDSNSTKSLRRRTLYASKTMETSEVEEVVNKVLSNVSIRRKTCFNIKSLEQTDVPEKSNCELANTPNRNANKEEMKTSCSTNRRRTLYAVQTINETKINTLNHNVTSGSSVCQTPTNFQTGNVISSTLLEDEDNRSKLVATPPADATSGKLLEEAKQCVTPLVFSSTRQPGNKRRTLFDVSMDIITQRLQCINQSARKSLAAPAPSAEAINTPEGPLNVPLDIKKYSDLLNNTTPQSLTNITNVCVNSNDGMDVDTPATNNLKSKRKLFMPNELLVTPPPAPASTKKALEISEKVDKLVTSTSNNITSNSVTMRRRTLMPISQPQPTTTICSSASTPNVRKRRSTLDFEQIQNIKTKAINDSKESSSTKSVPKKSRLQHHLKVKKTPVLAYTNMHQQQIDVIREAIDKLGVFVLESCVTDATTHLVSLEPRRTLNLLKALVRGLWILDYTWIVDSLNAGKWLPEESRELQDFSRGIEICRSERQAFGSNYKCDLFRKFGTFYISSQCCPINKENMRELITLCGGRVVNARQKARYIIGDANRTLKDKMYLTPYWVLDSITQMQLMKVHKYRYPQPDEKSESEPLPLASNT